MSLKAKFGKYKAKEVDLYLAQLDATHNEEIAKLNQRIDTLVKENELLKEENESHKKKEAVIAQVMLDATQRAREIEDDYRQRAEESDEACRKLHEEWVTGMQSAAVNLKKMRDDARQMLDSIDKQFEALCTWADMRLDSLENHSLSTSAGTESLETEIAKGAGKDLGEICKELGISSVDESEENAEDTDKKDSDEDNGGDEK